MTQKGKEPKKMILRTDAQKRAFVSPQRLELIGLFTDQKPLSVADMAERMGRPASALHYHVRVLEKAGLLKKKGQRRSGKRPEALYLPTADLFMMEQRRGRIEDAGQALKTMSLAFRMAERDMKAALENPRTCTDGPGRNMIGARIHCRLSKKELAELNRHLDNITKMLSRAQKNQKPSPDDQFLSLTLALMPLRNREVPS
jgi:DNA-binding transcriptional ArsR family regulator